MAPLPLVSQTELALIFGVSRQSVRAWEARGCPVERKAQRKGEPSRYSVAAVLRWREEQAAMAAVLGALDMNAARRRKPAAQATLAEIELAKIRGEVVEISAVAEKFGDALSAVRARLLALGSTLAPRLELATDVASRKEMIEDALKEALEPISGPVSEFLGGRSDDQAAASKRKGMARAALSNMVMDEGTPD